MSTKEKKMTWASAVKDKDLSKLMEDIDKTRSDVVDYAKDVSKNLSEKRATTSNYSEFLAVICSGVDDDYGIGTELCMSWMIDHYIALEFDKTYPLMKEAWSFLVDNGHTNRKKLRYSDTSEAFYVDDKRMIFVFGDYDDSLSRYLVIDDKKDVTDFMLHRCLVRQIWKRKKLDCCGYVERPTLQCYKDEDFNTSPPKTPWCYGDARDKGHILTYNNNFGIKKCDGAIDNIRGSMRFFRDIDYLYGQIFGKEYNAEK